MADYPPYRELPVRDGAPQGSAWGVFGDDDELGTVNFITEANVRTAAALVERGAVFALNWDLSLPAPAFFLRETLRHTVFEKYEGLAIDDYADSFWPQVSSQWDGLRHIAAPDVGFYNGASLAEVLQPGAGRLGIEKWEERGIVARGVLLDVVASVERAGDSLDPFEFFPIGPEVIEKIAAEQHVEIRAGDILVLRTGWVEGYERLDQRERDEYAELVRPGSPGLYGGDVPAFLWDNRIAAIAADNPVLEAGHHGKGCDLALHRSLIALLGVPLGELWDVQHLAADCAADGRYEFMLTSAPLRLGGGVGSPPNALALK